MKEIKLYAKVHWKEFCAGESAWYVCSFLIATLFSILRACYVALRYGASPFNHFIILLITSYMYSIGKRKKSYGDD
jgi:hypothetical protein